MARPRIHKHPTKLNLSVGKKTKQAAFKLASERGKSISQLVSELIEAEAVKEAA